MDSSLGPLSFFILQFYDLWQDTCFPYVLISLTRKCKLNQMPLKNKKNNYLVINLCEYTNYPLESTSKILRGLLKILGSVDKVKDI